MSHAIRVKKLVANAASLVIHFAHGGVLATGLIAMLFIAGRVGGASLPAPELGEWLVDSARAHAASVSAEDEGAESDEVPLSPEMRRVVEYLSRKYRVSATAIEPVVAAAQSAGTRVGLDPLLLVAVVAIESGFNPIAESALGARGLMQVIPRYHQEKLEEHGGDHALLDPVINIQIGARVLKESIRRAGSLQAGLQQYCGASNDAEAQYSNRVMAERQRLKQASHATRTAGA